MGQTNTELIPIVTVTSPIDDTTREIVGLLSISAPFAWHLVREAVETWRPEKKLSDALIAYLAAQGAVGLAMRIDGHADTIEAIETIAARYRAQMGCEG